MQRYVLVLFFFGIACQTTLAAVLREVESSELPDVEKMKQDQLASLLESLGVPDETLNTNDQSLQLIPSDLPSTSEEPPVSDNYEFIHGLKVQVSEGEITYPVIIETKSINFTALFVKFIIFVIAVMIWIARIDSKANK